MADLFQPGQHPDADQLSAFMEKALPEHERLATLGHLAECEECRSVVFLAQKDLLPEVQAATEPATLPWWQVWRRPALAAGLSFACIGVLVVSLVLQQSTKDHNKPVPEARSSPTGATQSQSAAGPEDPQNEVAATAELPLIQPKAVRPPAAALPSLQRSLAPPKATNQPAGVAGVMGGVLGGIGTGPAAPEDKPQASAAAPAPPMLALRQKQGAPSPGALTSASRGVLANSFALSSPAMGGPLRLNIEHGQATDKDLSEVRGTVRDAAGAAIPKATITLKGLSGQANATATSNAAGAFTLASLPAGPYEIQVASTGFLPLTQRVNLQAKDLAKIDPVLPAGSASQTVNVAADALRQETASVSSVLRKSAEGTFVAQTELQGTLLAFDSAGTLFRKPPGAKDWKKVKPRWHGVVTGLSVDAATASFLVTTGTGENSTGETWASRDGRHWKRR